MRFYQNLLFGLACTSLCVAQLWASDEKAQTPAIISSIGYVDYMIEQLNAKKQNIFPESGKNLGELGKTVVTYSKKIGVPGERKIYYGVDYSVECSDQDNCTSSKVDTNQIASVGGAAIIAHAWAGAIGNSIFNTLETNNKKFQEQLKEQEKLNSEQDSSLKKIDEKISDQQKKIDELAKRNEEQDTKIFTKQDMLPEAGVNAKKFGAGVSVVTYTQKTGELGERNVCAKADCKSDELVSAAAIEELVTNALVGKFITLDGKQYKIEAISSDTHK